MKNSAFVFIKPHADNEKTRQYVKKALQAKNMTILAEGAIDGETIDKNQYIDNHYYAIASKATILKPHQLNVPADKFEAKFGIGWQAALDAGKVFNALDTCEKLGCTADELDGMWAACKKAGNLIKFGGGFYCGEIKPGMYVFNGFFMTMRSKYVAKGCSIYYFVIEWEEKGLSWEDFRGKVLGPTDPTTAPADSVRGMIYKDWKQLGLPSIPNVGDNGVHASASPFEACAERMNWLGYKLEEDAFGKQMLAAGIPAATIKEWSVDPQVKYTVPTKGSLFDSVEDTDSTDCLAALQNIHKSSASSGKRCECGPSGACGGKCGDNCKCDSGSSASSGKRCECGPSGACGGKCGDNCKCDSGSSASGCCSSSSGSAEAAGFGIAHLVGALALGAGIGYFVSKKA